MSSPKKQPDSRRAVIVAGNRTPFVRSFGKLLKMDTIALGAAAVDGLLKRSGVAASAVDAIIWGGVVLPPMAPNVGRELALDLKLPPSIEALTVTRACASGLQAITLAAASIERGEADVVIAGGSDSTSNATVSMPPEFVHSVAPLAMGRASGAKAMFTALAGIASPSRILPKMPRVAERSTGEVMGEAAEKMAGIHNITREAQDELAFRSHQNAANAWQSGRFETEVTPVSTDAGEISMDDIVRPQTTLEKLSQLKPAFASEGTVTAGNASTLTDGASATLLMSEERALALGLTPLAYFSSWAYSGVDPADQLLLGPALAIPKALERAGLTLDQIEMVELHEAFAAQVLSILAALESEEFCQSRLARGALPKIDVSRLNIHGGSLAIGHPFAATGSRLVNTAAHELHTTNKKHALIGICAAGGLGAAAIISRCE